MSLADKMKDFKGKTIEFMENREAGVMNDLIDTEKTIVDFDIINSRKQKKSFAVFILKEDDKNYYFGGQVLTDFLLSLNNEEAEELRTKGCRVKFLKVKSENGFTYTNIDFV